MTDLYKWYVYHNAGDDVIDILDAFSRVYNRLIINAPVLYDPDNLFTSLAENIIEEAKEQLIIPNSWKTKEWFNLNDCFICTPPKDSMYTKEEIQKIIDDFNKWTALNIDIEWSLKNC